VSEEGGTILLVGNETSDFYVVALTLNIGAYAMNEKPHFSKEVGFCFYYV
jgi:hypothetical protein